MRREYRYGGESSAARATMQGAAGCIISFCIRTRNFWWCRRIRRWRRKTGTAPNAGSIWSWVRSNGVEDSLSRFCVNGKKRRDKQKSVRAEIRKSMGTLLKGVGKSDALWCTLSNVELPRINERAGGEHEED